MTLLIIFLQFAALFYLVYQIDKTGILDPSEEEEEKDNSIVNSLDISHRQVTVTRNFILRN